MRATALVICCGLFLARAAPGDGPAPRGKAPASRPDDWAEGAPGSEDGANHTYYNRRGQLPWRNREGDWRDAEGVQQGRKAFATAAVGKQSTAVEWDVTELVRGWASGKIPPKGVPLRNTKEAGGATFHSREADDPAGRPKLVVEVNGAARTLEAAADTFLTRSTVRGQGGAKTLRVEGALPALLRFNVGGLTPADKIGKATLRLVAAPAGAGAEVGVLACDQGEDVGLPHFGSLDSL